MYAPAPIPNALQEAFEAIRTLPFRLPENIDQSNRGAEPAQRAWNSVTKNMALAERLHALGHVVTPKVITFDWAELGLPAEICALWPADEPALHFFIHAQKDGLVYVLDASWDRALADALGLRLGQWNERRSPGLTATTTFTADEYQALELQWADDYARAYFDRVAPFMRAANAWLGAQRQRVPAETELRETTLST